jgi:hypothetical protein
MNATARITSNALFRSTANTIAHLRLPHAARHVQSARLTYLPSDALLGLYGQVRRVERDRVPGDLVECGCALGGSAIVLTAAKSPHLALHVYDVFGMIPPPTDKDGADVQHRYEVIRSGRSEGSAATVITGTRPTCRPQSVRTSAA